MRDPKYECFTQEVALGRRVFTIRLIRVVASPGPNLCANGTIAKSRRTNLTGAKEPVWSTG